MQRRLLPDLRVAAHVRHHVRDLQHHDLDHHQLDCHQHFGHDDEHGHDHLVLVLGQEGRGINLVFSQVRPLTAAELAAAGPLEGSWMFAGFGDEAGHVDLFEQSVGGVELKFSDLAARLREVDEQPWRQQQHQQSASNFEPDFGERPSHFFFALPSHAAL
mmetsp:Transcript_39260/g.126020  ORF Transcript_39260/g.126020 Transcript_39260/m.126020 type:complete len:160 (-) Transcript_39260:63-542(-)